MCIYFPPVSFCLSRTPTTTKPDRIEEEAKIKYVDEEEKSGD